MNLKSDAQTQPTGLLNALFSKRRRLTKPGQPLPLRAIPRAELHGELSQPAIYRLGHSTVLIRLDGQYLLTDPVFCENASPLRWPSLGLRRFQPTPVTMDDLPPLAAIIISHDHYDHLDRKAIRRLANMAERFVVPQGVAERLRRWGIAPGKITERGWWQNTSVRGIRLTATPTQHFTGRGLLDRNKTVAAGWAIEGEQARIFFGGDSGYFPGFREIGERFGGFDLTMLENGAYSPFWPDIHMAPEETLQAHIDLGGRALLPIHNGTFDLAFHPWFEPMERLHHLAMNAEVSVLTPVFGARTHPVHPSPTRSWWRDLMPAAGWDGAAVTFRHSPTTP